MSDRFARLLLLCAAVLAAAWLLTGGHARGPATAIHLTQAQWQVSEQAGLQAPPALQHSAALPPAWRDVALPFNPPIALMRQARSGTEGPKSALVQVSWLKIDVPAQPASAARLAVYGVRVKTDGTVAVYINGHLAHRAQQNGPLWNSTRTPLWFELDDNPAGGPVREILLRLEHTPKSQIALSTLWLGPSEELRSEYLVRHWLQQQVPAMLSAAFVAVGVFALFVWLRRRRETSYLLFFHLSATAFLRELHFYLDLRVENGWFAWLTVNSLFWLVLSVHFFLCQLHRRPLRGLTRGLVMLTLLIGLLTLPLLQVLPNMPTVTPIIYAIAAVMGAIACGVDGVYAWRHSGEGRLVVLGMLGCILLGLSDWMLQNNVVSAESWYFGAYTPTLCFIVFGRLMYRRYVDAIAEVERLNVGLAERLAAREAELEASHSKLRQVELQQTISNERQRLMQDMHDGLGSSLISAIRSVERGNVSDARVSQILKDCLDDLKLTIDSMEPVEADLLLLLATLRFRLAPRLEDGGVRLLWEVRETPALPWLNPTSALHILRIVQESVANILRHTQATEIRVGTSCDDKGVLVCIEDNGGGFDSEQALRSASGRGLQNQLRRAAALDARLSWHSSAAGTRFTLWLPLERPA